MTLSLFDIDEAARPPATREPARSRRVGGNRQVWTLNLFGSALSPERQRQVDALTCLRDSVPTALEVVTGLTYGRDTDTRAPSLGGDWAYCVCRAGLRFEAKHDWGVGALDRGETWGWSTPAHLVTWQELTGLIGEDPRRAEIAAWERSIPWPRWKVLMRPHELWPDPGGWHISYFCRDHVHEQWTARRRAWQLVLDLLTDAIDAGGAA